MRTLNASYAAAVDAVVTAPGHLVEWQFSPTPARWSDIGQFSLDGVTWAAMDMKFSRLQFPGDARPSGFSLTLGNLDSAVAALLLANDIAGLPVHVYSLDRAAVVDATSASVVYLGKFSATQVSIGIEAATVTCVPIFLTAPFRRVDAANGFTHATPEGTRITWGRELTIFEQARDWQLDAYGRYRGY